VYAISSGGSVHTLNPQTGDDIVPAVDLLPPNAKVAGSILVNSVFYAATTDSCGGAANGIWAVDLAGEAKTVTKWETGGAAVVGSAGPAFTADGTVIVATGEGTGTNANSLVALEARTLKVKDSFTVGTPFNSSPIAFQFKGKNLVVAANKDGRLYLLDPNSLGGTDHRTPLFRSTQYSSGAVEFNPGALATWEDSSGTRWILAATAGAVPSDTKFPVTNGGTGKGAIVAFKVVEQNDKPTLQPGWSSRELSSPMSPMILNNVVFAVASGEYRSNDSQLTADQRAQRSQRAVLYALDAATGRELWSSGSAITSFARGTGPSGGDSQVYVTTYDGMLYAFGVPLEH
jgi:hypothetical protein